MIDILNEENIKEGLKKFVGEFDNPRKYKIFENFVKCQVEVKNSYFNSLKKNNSGSFNDLKKEILKFDMLEEKFIFFQYILFKNPRSAESMLENHKKIIYKKIEGGLTEFFKSEYRKFKPFLPEGDLILLFGANDYNSFFDIINFVNFEKEGKSISLFLKYVESLDYDTRYVFEILKKQFHGFKFKDFIKYLNFVFIVEDKKTISELKDISLDFILEMMTYESEFSGYFVKNLYSTKDRIKMIFKYWDDEVLLRRYIETILHFSVAVDKNYGTPARAFSLFFMKILELDKDVFKKIGYTRDALFEIFDKEVIIRTNNDLQDSKEVLDRLNAQERLRGFVGYFDFCFMMYLIKKENYKLNKNTSREISKIFEMYVDRNKNGIKESLHFFPQWDYDSKINPVYNVIFNEFGMDLSILFSIFQIKRNKNDFPDDVKNRYGWLLGLKFIKGNDKRNKEFIVSWIKGGLGYDVEHYNERFGIPIKEFNKKIENRVSERYNSFKFLIDEFTESKKITKKRIVKKK